MKVTEAAEELYRQGVKIVAITLGRNGTYIYNKEGGRIVNGFAVEHVAASLCVEKKGAIPAMPKLTQVEERLEGKK